jgi:HD-like signal output (HDOD) protein
MDQAAKIVKPTGIPPCPAVLTAVMREVASNDPNARLVGELIERDAGLGAAILKIANSPLYALRVKVGNVREALATLGLRCCGNLVAGLMLRRAFAASGEPAMAAFWDTASTLSVMVGYLARECGVASLDDAQTFGLFRDCGAPLLMARYSSYGKVYRAAAASGAARITAVEHARFGLDHALVGAFLAKSWGMPEKIFGAIQWHHVRDEGGANAFPALVRHSRLIAVGALADVLMRSPVAKTMQPSWQYELAFASRTLGLSEVEISALHVDVSLLLQGV